MSDQESQEKQQDIKIPDLLEDQKKLALALKKQGSLTEAVTYLSKVAESSDSVTSQQDLVEANPEYSAIKAIPEIRVLPQQRASKHQPLTLANQDTSHSLDLVTIMNNFPGFIEPSQWTREALSPEEKTAEIILQKAINHLAENNWQDALEICEEVIATTPIASAYKTKGNILQKIGKISDAINCYHQALGIAPEFVEVYANLGGIYAQQQKWEKSVDAYQTAIQIKPNFAGAYRNLAKVWYQQGRKDKAIACTYQALSLEPDQASPQIHYNIGLELLQLGQIEEASQCFELAVKLDPQFTAAYQKLAETLEEQGKWQQAALAYRQALELSPKKSQIALISSATPSHQETEIDLVPQAGQDKISQAIQRYQFAIANEPDVAENYANLGSLYAQKQQWQEAITVYQQAIKIDPNFAGVYRNLARVLERLEKFAEASQYWFKALALEPDRATAVEHFQLGNSLLEQGDLTSAIVCYRQTIRLQPDYSPAYHQLGELLLEQNQSEQAVTCFREAVANNPQDAKSYQVLGRIYAAEQSWQSAINYYQKAIVIEPQDGRIYHDLGDAYLKQELWQEAVQSYSQARELDDHFSWTHHNLGDAFLKLNRWSEAIAAYRQAIALKSDFAWSYYNLGKALSKIKDWEEAYLAYQQGQKLDPELPQVADKITYALHYRIKSDFNSAYKLYLQAIKRNPDNLDNYEKALSIRPQSADLYLAWGQALIDQQKIDAAISCYEKALEIKPNFAEAHRQLADLLERVGNEEAADHRYLALQNAPQETRVEAYLELGNTFLSQKQPLKAEKCYRQALEISPHLVEPYLCLGKLLIQQQKWESARDLYQQAVVQHPGNIDFFYHLGETQSHQQQWEKTISSYQKVITLEPNFWQAYHYQGDALLNLEQWSSAVDCYQQTLTLNPHYIWSYHNLGVALTKLEQWSEAISCYDKISELAPEFWQENQGDFTIQSQLGDILFQQEKWSEAIVFYQRVSQIKPNDFWSHHNLGKAYYNLEQWDQAIASWQTAARLNSKCAWTRYYLGEIYAHQESWDLAVSAYRESLAISTDIADVQNKLSHALHQQAKSNIADASEYYRSQIAKNPSDIESYRKLLEITQNDPTIYYGLANALVTADKIHEASIYYQKAIKLKPDYDEAFLQLGEILSSQRRWQEAIFDLACWCRA